MLKPSYENLIAQSGCQPPQPAQITAPDILQAIKSADDLTKQQLKEALSNCSCKEAKDMFGDNPIS